MNPSFCLLVLALFSATASAAEICHDSSMQGYNGERVYEALQVCHSALEGDDHFMVVRDVHGNERKGWDGLKLNYLREDGSFWFTHSETATQISFNAFREGDYEEFIGLITVTEPGKNYTSYWLKN